MVEDLKVTIGAVSASTDSDPVVDDLGCKWFLGDFTGWFSGVGVTAGSIQRPLSDGTLPGPAPLTGRPIIVGGMIVAPSRGALMASLERVGSVLTGQERVGDLVVREGARDLTRQVTVRLDGASKAEPVAGQRIQGRFEFSLYADDPAKYSAEMHSDSNTRFISGAGRAYPVVYPRVYGAGGNDGVLSVVNAGNRATWPTYSFVGPLLNPTVRIVGGPQITVLIDLLAGQELVIDTANRTVLLGTSSRRSSLTFDSEWFAINPGTTDVSFIADDGIGTAQVFWRDAWT